MQTAPYRHQIPDISCTIASSRTVSSSQVSQRHRWPRNWAVIVTIHPNYPRVQEWMESYVFSALLSFFKKTQALTLPNVLREVSGFNTVRERPSVIFSSHPCVSVKPVTAANCGRVVLNLLHFIHRCGSIIRCHGSSLILCGSEGEDFDLTLVFQKHRNTKVMHRHLEKPPVIEMWCLVA